MLISWASQRLRRSCMHRWVGGDSVPPSATADTHQGWEHAPSGHCAAGSSAPVGGSSDQLEQSRPVPDAWQWQEQSSPGPSG